MKKLILACCLLAAACGSNDNDAKIERIEKNYASNEITLKAIESAKDKNFGRRDSLLTILKWFDEKAYHETKSIIEGLK